VRRPPCRHDPDDRTPEHVPGLLRRRDLRPDGAGRRRGGSGRPLLQRRHVRSDRALRARPTGHPRGVPGRARTRPGRGTGTWPRLPGGFPARVARARYGLRRHDAVHVPGAPGPGTTHAAPRGRPPASLRAAWPAGIGQRTAKRQLRLASRGSPRCCRRGGP
jgi:hypothetical protein